MPEKEFYTEKEKEIKPQIKYLNRPIRLKCVNNSPPITSSKIKYKFVLSFTCVRREREKNIFGPVYHF